jgi:hypothetical protein
MFLVSCTHDDTTNRAGGAASTSTDAAVATAQPSADPGLGGGSTSSTAAPSTLPDVGVDLTADEQACVDAQMADDAGMVQREAVERCVGLVTFGPTLVEGLAQDFPGRYTPEQLDCIRVAYSELSGEDLEALVATGLDPDGDKAAHGEDVIVSLFNSCDAEVPASSAGGTK